MEYNKNLEDSKSDALLHHGCHERTAMTCFNILWLPQHFRDDNDGKVEFIQAMDKAMELEGKGFAWEGTDI